MGVTITLNNFKCKTMGPNFQSSTEFTFVNIFGKGTAKVRNDGGGEKWIGAEMPDQDG